MVLVSHGLDLHDLGILLNKDVVFTYTETASQRILWLTDAPQLTLRLMLCEI
jgi:hypothetical protein